MKNQKKYIYIIFLRFSLTISLPDLFQNHTFCHMDFSCGLQKRDQLPQIAIKQVTDTFILKGINGPSFGNAFECHVRRVRETRAT
jgi:hypothetical protein